MIKACMSFSWSLYIYCACFQFYYVFSLMHKALMTWLFSLYQYSIHSTYKPNRKQIFLMSWEPNLVWLYSVFIHQKSKIVYLLIWDVHVKNTLKSRIVFLFSLAKSIFFAKAVVIVPSAAFYTSAFILYYSL